MHLSVFPSFLMLLSANAALADKADPASLPWSDLSDALVSGPEVLITTDEQDYITDCLPMFELDPASRSSYDIMDKPSGLCMTNFFCGAERCCPDVEYLNGTIPHSPNFWLQIQTGWLVRGDTFPEEWSDAANPAWNLPHNVLHPKVAGDVVEAVRFAKTHNLELSVKTSGHSYTGASTKRNTLLINMRSYNRYASGMGEITECGEEQGVIEPDLSNQACEVAIAWGSPGIIRVGGGEIYGEVYPAVKDYNEANGYKFHIVGGAAATVSPMGWTWSGGLAGTAGGRLFGFGVDQVLQIEAVLPNGEHVKFGPTEWEDASGDGYLVPKTTSVSGVCNANYREDESAWSWTECPVDINFDDLWFAFRGGHGGTWGVVLSVHLRLHDYLPLETPYWLTCSLPSQESTLQSLILDFTIDYLLNPDSLGISKTESNSCGASDYPGLFSCYGEGTGDAVVETWKSFIMSRNDTLLQLNVTADEIEYLSTCMGVSYNVDYAEQLINANAGTAWEGKPSDGDNTNPWQSTTEKSMHILIKKSWILENKDLVVPFLVGQGIGTYLAFGENPQFGHDQTTSLSIAHREAGFMLPFNPFQDPSQIYPFIQQMYDFSSTEFPAYLGANHLSPSTYGPYKSDWSTLCPYELTRIEREEQCISAQEAVWGSEILNRLESIKEEIDPDGMFDCFRCVGNEVLSEEVSSTAPTEPEPTVPTAEPKGTTIAPYPEPTLMPTSSAVEFTAMVGFFVSLFAGFWIA